MSIVSLHNIDINFFDFINNDETQIFKCFLDNKSYTFSDNKINEDNSLLPSFNAVLNNDINYIDKYIKTTYIYKNITLQTSLMLACYISNYDMVLKLLDKEIGYVDLYDRSALFYAMNSIKPDERIIKLISEYEYFNL